MEDEKILIDRKTLKAISSDTRMDLLKYLSKRKYTLSELSNKLNLKASTVKEHLDNLINSDLVEKENTENKWKYYSLTEKGKKLVNPKEVKLLISFIISFIATIGAIGFYIINFVVLKTGMGQKTSRDFQIMESLDVEVSQKAVSTVTDSALTQSTNINNSEIFIIIGIIFLFSITLFLTVLLINEKRKNRIKVID
jgi:DNA-binding MarR family transcriptional regulator